MLAVVVIVAVITVIITGARVIFDLCDRRCSGNCGWGG